MIAVTVILAIYAVLVLLVLVDSTQQKVREGQFLKEDDVNKP